MKCRALVLCVKGVPPGVRYLAATVDVQKYRFDVQGHVFGEGGDITVTDRFAIRKSHRKDEDGDPDRIQPATYIEDWDVLIHDVLLRTYPLGDGSGRVMGIKMTGCDSGGSAAKKNDSSTTMLAYEFWR